jgi:hypothetical protein
MRHECFKRYPSHRNRAIVLKQFTVVIYDCIKKRCCKQRSIQVLDKHILDHSWYKIDGNGGLPVLITIWVSCQFYLCWRWMAWHKEPLVKGEGSALLTYSVTELVL